MKRILGIVAATGVAVGGLAMAPSAQSAPQSVRAQSATVSSSAAAASPAPTYTPPPIEWGACTNRTLQAFGAECGTVIVPLDYAKPDADKVSLAVSRLRHTTPDSEYQGVTLVNPGGPGGSGLVYSILQQFIPDDAGLSYDWIGFDPRGVGASVPRLTCDGTYFGFNRPYYVPVTHELENTWLARTKGYAQDCKAAGGKLLDHIKTTDWVADMESIRVALGEQKINFYGFSYGTYLGQVYATLHPDRVRRFVFDGNVDPRDVWYQANLNQDLAFDRNIGIYFDWLAKHDDAYHLGTDGAAIEATYYRILEELRSQPQVDGKLGPDEWNDAFIGAAYYVYGWDDTAHAFAAAVNDGDYAPILGLSGAGGGPGSDNTYAVYLAVQCSDVKWPSSWETWRRDNDATYAVAPFLTWNNAWYNAPCRWWGGKTGTPVDVDGSGAPPILLISETLDAATPFEGSLEVRSRFPSSVLVEGVGGTTHAGSLSGIACVDDTIADYFATGALPARVPGRRSDLQCDPVPPPDPTLASLRSAAPSTTTTQSPEMRELREQLQPRIR